MMKPFSSSLCVALSRVWSLWAADLRGSSQNAPVSEENAGSDRSPGSRKEEPEKQTHRLESSEIRNHRPLWARQTVEISDVVPRRRVSDQLSDIYYSSYVPSSQRRGERRPELLLCDTRRDGEGHQGEPVPGARRVRREPLRHQDRLYPRGGGDQADLHPRRQPSGGSEGKQSEHSALLCCCCNIVPVYSQALKVLKTAEFMPFVVFIAAPELDTLREMHKAVVDAGLTTKLLTVRKLEVPVYL